MNETTNGMEFLDVSDPIERYGDQLYAQGFAEGFAKTFTEAYIKSFAEEFSIAFAEAFDRVFSEKADESARLAAYRLLDEKWSITKISQFLDRSVDEIESWAKEFGHSYHIN